MKVYLYCTKNSPTIEMIDGKCYYMIHGKRNDLYCLNGKIACSFDLNKVEEIYEKLYGDLDWQHDYLPTTNTISIVNLEQESCLDREKISKYLKDGKGYAWHIDNLEILEEPIDILAKFYTRHVIDRYGISSCSMIMKAPKDWCYARYLYGHDCIIMSVNSNELYKIINENKTIIIKKSIPKEFK